jgi:hypothetical protein
MGSSWILRRVVAWTLRLMFEELLVTLRAAVEVLVLRAVQGQAPAAGTQDTHRPDRRNSPVLRCVGYNVDTRI